MFAYVNLHGVFHLIENKKTGKNEKKTKKCEEEVKQSRIYSL